MSDTPRTDTEIINNLGRAYSVSSTFARQLERELTALKAENAELVKDKARLDWMETEKDTLSWDDSDFWTVWNGYKATTGNTIREAIDSAMQKQPPPPQMTDNEIIIECSNPKNCGRSEI